jgi:hypothetical protein
VRLPDVPQGLVVERRLQIHLIGATGYAARVPQPHEPPQHPPPPPTFATGAVAAALTPAASRLWAAKVERRRCTLSLVQRGQLTSASFWSIRRRRSKRLLQARQPYSYIGMVAPY